MKMERGPRKKAEAGDFESQLAALEQIVRELERGDLPLEESLQKFEQGVRLSRECQERLNEAERRIELLLRDGEGRPLVAPLDDDQLGPGSESAAEDDEDVF